MKKAPRERVPINSEVLSRTLPTVGDLISSREREK